jgi:uncharacterized radical SAM superfamily protein
LTPPPDGKRVVLLAPPSSEVQLRDLYCSITSKGNYYWPPIDLLVVSGRLKASCRLTVVDAVAERLSPGDAARRVADARPDVVVSLVGSSSWPGDSRFLADLKRRLGCRLVATGDLCVERSHWLLEENGWLDAFLTDFTAEGITEYVAADVPPDRPLAGLVHRAGGALRDGRTLAAGATTFAYPPPVHEAFPLHRYRLPYVSEYPFSTVLTNHGCRFACSYCIQNKDIMGHKSRPLENVVEELDRLKALGVRTLYFRDPLFESHAADALALCRLLRERYDFAWSCNCRVNTVTPELIAAMKAAGCRCVAFGFETADEEILRRYDKPVTLEQARRAIRLCRENGIRVAGYYILGLPGEDERSVRATIRFAVESGVDFASFSVPSPDYGTALRADSIRRGAVDPAYRTFDRSRVDRSLADGLDERLLQRLLRRAYREFYGRPSRLFRTLLMVRSARQLKEVLRAAVAVFRRCL